MISKAKIKDVRSLHLQKFRQIYNKFIVEGGKACTEFIKTGKFKIEDIFIMENSLQKYQNINGFNDYHLNIVSGREMEQISTLKTPADILIVAVKTEESIEIMKNSNFSAIYMDDVQDPGNVGTIIRIADWFGIEVVLRSSGTADFFNPKVVQATMGSMVNVNLITAELSELTKYNRTIYGTYMDGSTLFNESIESNAIIVMGNEGNGISTVNEKFIHKQISIPGADHRIADSLNVAISAGIICSYWKK